MLVPDIAHVYTIVWDLSRVVPKRQKNFSNWFFTRKHIQYINVAYRCDTENYCAPTLSINRSCCSREGHQNILTFSGRIKVLWRRTIFNLFIKMKLALISLTLCCIYVSISQQQFMPRRYPLPFYYNSYYDSPQLSRNNLMRQGPLFVVRNNYVQPYSRPSFDNEQIPVVTY